MSSRTSLEQSIRAVDLAATTDQAEQANRNSARALLYDLAVQRRTVLADFALQVCRVIPRDINPSNGRAFASMLELPIVRTVPVETDNFGICRAVSRVAFYGNKTELLGVDSVSRGPKPVALIGSMVVGNAFYNGDRPPLSPSTSERAISTTVYPAGLPPLPLQVAGTNTMGQVGHAQHHLRVLQGQIAELTSAMHDPALNPSMAETLRST